MVFLLFLLSVCCFLTSAYYYKRYREDVLFEKLAKQPDRTRVQALLANAQTLSMGVAKNIEEIDKRVAAAKTSISKIVSKTNPPVKERLPKEIYSAETKDHLSDKATVPVCMDCGTYMIPGGSGAVPTTYGVLVPVEQYLCPRCGLACTYVATPAVKGGKSAGINTYSFWSHPKRRAEFKKRIEDTFMPFKNPGGFG